MNQRTKNIVSTAVFATLGVGLLYIVTKYRKNIIKKIRLACDFRNPLRYQSIEVVNTVEECKLVIKKLKGHAEEYNVLGFDCEWVTVGGTRRPIALLQLASHKGYCALIRLCHLQRIPTELRELLEDDNIIKVGVVPHDDACLLAQDYSICVASTLDLRHLFSLTDLKPEGLARMAKSQLNIEMDKNWRIRCSDWEAKELSEHQLEYAANDAHVAIQLFKKAANKVVPSSLWKSKKKALKEVLEISEQYFDMKFKQKSTYGNNKNSGSSNNKIQKEFKRSFATRATPLYQNCLLQAPDGELLCTCDRKKAQWYVHKDIGFVVEEEPFTVRLKFEPAGRAVGEVGKYYQQVKVNCCVVCGKQESYIRKNVVPREYRKLFPLFMKEHISHDVLLLCVHCHQKSNITDLKLRKKLAALCEAPISSKDGDTKFIELPHIKQIKSFARALLEHSHEIPEERKAVLRKGILDHYSDKTELTEEFLNELNLLSTSELCDNFTSHAQKVTDYFNSNNGGLTELEKMWRENFLANMKPKFLPELWSVDHNATRLEIKANEGRVNENELVIAGLDPSMRKRKSTSEETDTYRSLKSSYDGTTSQYESCFSDTDSEKTVGNFQSCFSGGSSISGGDSDQTLVDFSSDDEWILGLEDDDISKGDDYDSDDTNSNLSQPSSRSSDVDDDDEKSLDVSGC